MESDITEDKHILTPHNRTATMLQTPARVFAKHYHRLEWEALKGFKGLLNRHEF